MGLKKFAPIKRTLLPLLLLATSLLGCASNETTSVASGSLPKDRPAPSALTDRSVLTGPSSAERIEGSLKTFEQSVTAAQR